MRDTKMIMGMPVIVEIADTDANVNAEAIKAVFDYFVYVDEKFSTYKNTSEISAINAGKLAPADYSDDMKEIFTLSEETKKQTSGYFDIVNRQGKYDPSGIVKGWAIYNASKILRERGVENFFIDAGGDIQTGGTHGAGKPWSVGIADPFEKNYGGAAMIGAPSRVIKVVKLSGGEGVATSGTAVRGQHIYNPHKKADQIHDIVSLTVIGPNIYEADRFATAAFAMGKSGIQFIENLRIMPAGNSNSGKEERFEAYMIDAKGIATMTSGFEKYTL